MLIYRVRVMATGPFNIPTLTQMAVSGQFTANDLVWKNGMEECSLSEQVL